MVRAEVDRSDLMEMDLDHYEARLILDLKKRLAEVTRALQGLVAAAGDASVANREEALAGARRALASSKRPESPLGELHGRDPQHHSARGAPRS